MPHFPVIQQRLLVFVYQTFSGADPGFFLGGGALVSCSTSTPINHIVFFFLQNTSCIRKPQVISGGGGGGGAHPLHPPPRSAPAFNMLIVIADVSLKHIGCKFKLCFVLKKRERAFSGRQKFL